jgi:hypothetical protein
MRKEEEIVKKINELYKRLYEYRRLMATDPELKMVSHYAEQLFNEKIITLEWVLEERSEISMLTQLYRDIGEFSMKVFPDAGPIQHMLKLKEEADEVIANNYDKEEYADCLIALFAAAYKSNITLGDLINHTKVKLSINIKRKWKKLKDGTYKHY